MEFPLFNDDLNTLFRRKTGDVQEIRSNSVPRSLGKRLPGRVNSFMTFFGLGQIIPSQFIEDVAGSEILAKHCYRDQQQEFARVVLDPHVLS